MKADGAVSDELLQEMLEECYSLILASLPKKVQQEILEEKL